MSTERIEYYKKMVKVCNICMIVCLTISVACFSGLVSSKLTQGWVYDEAESLGYGQRQLVDGEVEWVWNQPNDQ